MRVLCVAEKPSISKSITQILSGGQFDNVSVISMLDPPLHVGLC
jgi:DNA topoisomerase IA